MVKRFIYFLFLTTFHPNLFAQLQAIDELKNDSLITILNQGKTDSIQARAAYHLAKLWINIDSTKGQEYLQKGKKLSKNSDYLNAIYRYQTIPSYKDEKEVNTLLAIFRRHNTPDSWDYQYRLSINRVRWLLNQIRPEEAIKLLKNNVIPLNNKLKVPSYTAEIHLEMGRAFLNQSMEYEAIPYLDKAATILEKITTKTENILYDQIHTLGSLGNAYNAVKKNRLADSVIRRAKEILLIQPNLIQEVRIASTEAMHLLQTSQYSKAESLIKFTLNKARKLPARFSLSLYFQQHKVRAALGDPHSALNILTKSHPIDSIPLNRNKYATVNMSELLKAYAIAYEGVNDYKQATKYWMQYFSQRDSIQKDRVAREISKLEVQLRTQQKDAEIHNLETHKREHILRLKNHRIMNILFAITALLLLILLILLLKLYRSKQKTAASQLRELEHKRENQIANALLEGEERERQRIGRDLHDGLGGSLSGIRMQLAESQHKHTDPILDKAMGQLEESIADLRRISSNMVPESLLSRGLNTALSDLCVSYSGTHTTIEYQSNSISEQLPIHIQTNIYRIVQELLCNAIKHGKAKNIIVQFLQDGNSLLITIEDDGTGFDIENKDLNNGIGLQNIESRIQYLHGSYQIESTMGQGTTVNIELHVR